MLAYPKTSTDPCPKPLYLSLANTSSGLHGNKRGGGKKEGGHPLKTKEERMYKEFWKRAGNEKPLSNENSV